MTYIQRLSEWFVAEPQSVPSARQAVGSVRGVLGAEVCEDVCLLVSELVANAVIHGSDRPSDAVRMQVWTSPERVRVVVRDRGGAFDDPPDATGESELGGWGLCLVERIADRWGVRRTDATEVWFEIDSDRGSVAVESA